MSVAIGLVAPASAMGNGFHISGRLALIVIIIAVLGGLAIFGWRSPDRSPGADTKAERERIDD